MTAYETEIARLLNASNARFQAGSDAHLASRAKPKAVAAKPKFIVATRTETVEFLVDAATVAVKRHTLRTGYRYETMSLDSARAEYQRLIGLGYRAW